MLALRLVLDTNVVLSALLSPRGLPRTVLTIATTRPARLYLSLEILAEYKEVLSRPELGIRLGLRNQFLQQVRNRANLVRATIRRGVTSDPDDNIFTDCADAARADYLVTGNLRHFPRFWKQTKIVSSREILELVAPHLFSR
jgi:uncharacterized protein